MSSYNFLSCLIGVRGGKIWFGAAWYEEFCRKERQITFMATGKDFRDDPEWQMLPLARREIALHRFEIMHEYERHKNPGDGEAKFAAQQLGVTTGQFYRIRRQWLQRRSIYDLLPYGQPGLRRKPKLDPEVAEATNSIIEMAAARGMRAQAEILKYIRDAWTLNKPLPSHMTLRKKIDEVLGEVRNVSGGISVSNHSFPKLSAANPDAYGEVIAIDHAGLNVFVATEGGPVAPVITLALDLYTSAIVGFTLSFGAPGPLQFEAVLKDAETRSKRMAQPGMELVKPRLVFQAGGVSAWSKLMSRLEKNDFRADVIRVQRLNFGELLTLIGSSIGKVEFARRRSLNDLVFNPGRDALVSFEDLKRLVEDGVEQHNKKRLASDTAIRPLELDF